MLDTASMILVGAAAFVAGFINAIAGGGSLVSFPVLVAVGLSPVIASLTNTVALCPGYFGAAVAQRAELAGQGWRIVRIVPVAVGGGVAGALLLLYTDEGAFDRVVPFLILMAAAILALQERLRRWLFARTKIQHSEGLAAVPVAFAAVYGGYFGAGMGVMVLASLAVVLADTLTRINALKQTVSLAVNVSAACVFLVSGRIDWPIAGVMLACSLGGGVLGGVVASKIPTAVLRWLVVVVATAVSIVYFARW